MTFIIILKILFNFLTFVFAVKESASEENLIHLTDAKTTHFAIPYLSTDQCIPRPGQKSHGSYGLILYRRDYLLCDSLLICYPSQLNGNNTRYGTISSIPYRLRAINKNVNKECENRQKKFCKENKNLCFVGQPASTIWHGIKISSEYIKETNNFNLKINLSITERTYTLSNFSLLNIEFGRQEDIFTHIYPAQEIKDKLKYKKLQEQIFDEDISKEFLSNVDIGAYLHKYAGIWTLGVDLLPSSDQRLLNLFVYRGCACKVEAWFKSPTTPVSLMHRKSERVNRTLPDKDCLERYTNQKHYLGDINKEWKKVTFIIWSGNKGKSGSIEILNKKGVVVLGINFKKNTVEFKNNHEGKWKYTDFDIDNFLTSGALMNVTLYLNKYSASISLNSKEINKFYNNTFWPSNWWTGRFMIKDKPM
uniref:Uncharacterized protein n=1 Tax=Meloidogyne enterolobii TaxID=390850 RepID=A0A6V7XQC2_MELEN|nr:unnamed protein product [Meloidogyne enterolobii]